MEDWNKIIRDPIHNIVYFRKNETDNLLLKLIHTKEFQRLRRIKQLGPAEMVFPGANHSRFSHSLGVMHVAKAILDRIERLQNDKFPPQTKQIVLSAALLHDIGHGPFSHAFEAATNSKHEQRTEEIIKTETTEVYKCLYEYDRALPFQLAAFFDKDPAEAVAKTDIPPFLAYIVSSQLDGDRLDYLLRDSYHTGTDYGKYDLNWLLENLYYDDRKKILYLGRKAFAVVENYIFARYHMYKSVYFHKASRAAEVMFHLLLKRYQTLLINTPSFESRKKIAPDAPPKVLEAFSGKMALEHYLLLDDYTLTEFFKACQDSNDKTLRLLGDGLINRRLFKCVDATGKGITQITQFNRFLQTVVKNNGWELDCDILMDSPKDTPYKPYEFLSDKPATQIFIEESGGLKEISSISEPVNQLKKYNFIRFYYPKNIKDEVEKEAKKILG